MWGAEAEVRGSALEITFSFADHTVRMAEVDFRRVQNDALE